MKVKELIEELKKCDQEVDVVVLDTEYMVYWDVNVVVGADGYYGNEHLGKIELREY